MFTSNVCTLGTLGVYFILASQDILSPPPLSHLYTRTFPQEAGCHFSMRDISDSGSLSLTCSQAWWLPVVESIFLRPVVTGGYLYVVRTLPFSGYYTFGLAYDRYGGRCR